MAKQTPATKTQKIHKASTGKLPALRSSPDIHKVSVFARYLDKLLMSSALNHPTVVHNKDLVRLLDRCQTMCDRHDRLAFVSSEIAAWIRCSFSGSTLAVASSSMMIGASLRIALAMEIRCFSPPDRLPPPSPITVS